MSVTREKLLADMKRGEEIKSKAKEKGVPVWWLAKSCGMADGNFSRLLRNLSEEDFERLSNVIDALAAEQ